MLLTCPRDIWFFLLSGVSLGQPLNGGIMKKFQIALALLAGAVSYGTFSWATNESPKSAAKAVLSYDPDSQRLRVEGMDEQGNLTSTLMFEPTNEGLIARGPDGQILMSAKPDNGALVLADASGKIMGRYDPS